MVNKFLETIYKHKMLDDKKKNVVVLGVSGGADSVCLLNLFLRAKKNFDLKIIVAHLNHNLRGVESDRDENFVTNICTHEYKQEKIILEKKKIDVKKFAHEKKINLEEAGRVCRYEFFFDLIKKYNGDKIATAHNKNDNVETILMKLIRGCGSDGFAGINPNQDKIIRPLIEISRCEIENYCQNNKLDFVTDSSNLNCEYTRNKIRNKIMPILKEINPNFLNTITESSKIISQENNYLAEKAKYIIKSCGCNEESLFLDINKIKSLPDVLKNKVIYMVLKRISEISICQKKVNTVLSLITKNRGKQIFLGKNIIAKKEFDKIVFYNLNKKRNNESVFEYKIKPEEIIFIKQIEKYILVSKKNNLDTGNIFANMIILCKKSFYCDNLGRIVVRNYKTGDKIFFFCFLHKKLKKIFSEKKILNDERFRIPLLAINSQIIWIMDKRIDIISNNAGVQEKKYFIYILGDI